LRLNLHYINLSRSETIRAEARVVFHAVAADQVTTLGAGLFLTALDIHVPPGTSGSASTTCATPHELNLINVQSHMHQHAKHFQATLGSGEVLYQNDSWDEPLLRLFNPPRTLAAGAPVTLK